MPKRRLKVIPEPAPSTRTVLVQLPEKAKLPLRVGQGKFDLVCGSCDSILAKNVVDGQARGVVFKCSECGTFNDSE